MGRGARGLLEWSMRVKVRFVSFYGNIRQNLEARVGGGFVMYVEGNKTFSYFRL